MLKLNDPNSVGPLAQSSFDLIIDQCREVCGGVEQEDLEKALLYVQLGPTKGMLQSHEHLPAQCDWSALLEFFASEWFTRKWIVQEIVLAPRAVCIYGKCSTDWRRVSLVSRWMQHRQYFRDVTRHPGTVGIDNTSVIRDIAESGEARTLHNMLCASSVFLSTDPRDQVYGVLGLLSRETTTLLQPDYNKSVKDLFSQATRAAIAEAQDLMAITLSNTRDPEPGTGHLDRYFPILGPPI